MTRYIPALHFSWLTPLYDPLIRRFMREEEIKRHFVGQMGLRPGMRLLDVGCGTGTLAILILQTQPGVIVSGLDGDPDVLARAAAKAARAGVAVQWNRGLATELPYADGSFDRVVSSLVTHHLTVTDKQEALAEAYRVLRPGGELHVLDFGPPFDAYTRLAAAIMRHFEEVAAQFDGRLPALIRAAGFAEPEAGRRFTVLFGPLHVWRTLKPNTPNGAYNPATAAVHSDRC
jgi:ubiquinone/menaquinone biosynthesis C-methylase UbiE